MIAYSERIRFRLGPAQGMARRKFREIWVAFSEKTKRNLGDSGTKLWSRAIQGANHTALRLECVGHPDVGAGNQLVRETWTTVRNVNS